jgi:hypothetical protein
VNNPRVKVSRYTSEQKCVWDSFVKRSKNGVFLFARDYMEYHTDRFNDFSLMFHNERDHLVALLPASMDGGDITSHAGLTFGGVVTDDGMKAAVMLELFDALEAFLRDHEIGKVIYKAVPHIYHRVPAEEDLYALFRRGARLFRRDISSTVDLRVRLPFSKGRKWSARQARKAGLRIEKSQDFRTFMRMEEELLIGKYNVKPTHTGAQLELLASRFPEQIKLFVALHDDSMMAGVVIYEYDRVAHAQYISASEEGKRVGALDLILEYLITDYYAHMNYFDFGISTESGGQYLNAGLIENKQSFGGRAVVHDFYEWDLVADRRPASLSDDRDTRTR